MTGPMLSRRRFLVRSAVAALGTFLSACAAVAQSIVPSRSTPTSPPTPGATTSPAPAPSSAVGPPLRESIARMLLVGFRGLTAEEVAPTIADLAERGLGGVLLFSRDQLTGADRNVASPEQLRSLVAELKAVATVPLIVAIDQEGGQVARLGPRHGFPATPSAAAMGTGEPAETAAIARAMATTLADAGVTLNLAPVVDLAINPDNPIIAGIERSFSADPATVIAHASAFIEGHHEIGVRCAIKHFPGQGSASADTHLGIVDVTDAWTEVELEPFTALAASRAADAVLTAHIFNAALDPDHPATLSRATVTGILRDRIGFAGPVISDDLQMGAIRDAVGYEEAVALAIEAGIDLLLIANQLVYEPEIVNDTIAIVERHVRDGRLSEARIRESVARVDRLRA
jgi:beta-N-acetylhexosaminidase